MKLGIVLVLLAFCAGCEYASRKLPSAKLPSPSDSSDPASSPKESEISREGEPSKESGVHWVDKALTTDPVLRAKARGYEEQAWDQLANFRNHVLTKLGNTTHWKDYSSATGWSLYHTLSDLYSLAWAIDVAADESRRKAYAALAKEILDKTTPLLAADMGSCTSEEYVWPSPECPHYQQGEGSTGGYACSRKQCVLRYLDEAHAAGGAGMLMNAIFNHPDLYETYKSDLSLWAQNLKPVLDRNVLRTKSQAEGGYLNCSGPHMSAKIAPGYLAAGKILGDPATVDAFANIVEEIAACMDKDPNGWVGADISHAQISSVVVHLGYAEALRGNVPSKVTKAQLARLGDGYFLQPPYTYNGVVVPDIHHGILAGFSQKIAAQAEETYAFDETPGSHAYTRKFQNVAGFMMGFATKVEAPLPAPTPRTACAAGITTTMATGPACTSASLQAAIDAAKAGDKLLIESKDGGICTATKAIKIAKPLTLCGKGFPEIRRTDDFSLIGSHEDGAVLHITSSDVVVEGLALVGSEYGNVQVRNTHGIWVHGIDATKPVSHLTIRNNTLKKFRGRGISLRWVDDFIVENNTVEDVGYVGIMPDESRRGIIRENKITDVNDPEVCSLDAANPKKCQYVNGYPIVVGGCGSVPCSEDIIISKNVVRENEVWVGIMNHGGHRVLVVDNEVYDTDFLYANTVSEPAGDASHKTWFVNNYGDVSPPNERYKTYQKGDGLWFAGFNSPATEDVAAIGNILLNTGNDGKYSSVWIDSAHGGRFTWNTLKTTVGTAPRYGFEISVDQDPPPAGQHKDIVIAHNEIQSAVSGIFSKSPAAEKMKIVGNRLLSGQKGLEISAGSCGSGPWHVQDNDFSKAGVSPIVGIDVCTQGPISETTPPAPVLSAATVDQPGTVLLTWTYDETTKTPHDSFTIEYKTSAETAWKKLAYRPPNDPDWKFAAPTNPDWEPYPTLRHLATGLVSGSSYDFRIRANSSSVFSSWAGAQAKTL